MSSTDVAYIDAADMSLPLTLRKWRTGDYFYPLGMNMKKKKVSKLLIDSKVPIHKKEQLRILESGKKILWVAGMRLDERCKVKSTTTSVIEVTVTEL
jgi:tRNA(Ile)-lysidine synthase